MCISSEQILIHVCWVVSLVAIFKCLMRMGNGERIAGTVASSLNWFKYIDHFRPTNTSQRYDEKLNSNCRHAIDRFFCQEFPAFLMTTKTNIWIRNTQPHWCRKIYILTASRCRFSKLVSFSHVGIYFFLSCRCETTMNIRAWNTTTTTKIQPKKLNGDDDLYYDYVKHLECSCIIDQHVAKNDDHSTGKSFNCDLKWLNEI